MSGIVSLDCRQAGETECLSSGSLARTLEPQLKFLSYTHTLHHGEDMSSR